MYYVVCDAIGFDDQHLYGIKDTKDGVIEFYSEDQIKRLLNTKTANGLLRIEGAKRGTYTDEFGVTHPARIEPFNFRYVLAYDNKENSVRVVSDDGQYIDTEYVEDIPTDSDICGFYPMLRWVSSTVMIGMILRKTVKPLDTSQIIIFKS